MKNKEIAPPFYTVWFMGPSALSGPSGEAVRRIKKKKILTLTNSGFPDPRRAGRLGRTKVANLGRCTVGSFRFRSNYR